MRRRLLTSARSVLLGWVALFAITYLVERPLLLVMPRLLGSAWLPTGQLALECVTLAATGWIIGRWNRADAVPSVVVFTVSIAVWNFGLTPAIDVAWLFRLLIDSFGNPRYLESLVTTATAQALLFGSLFTGVQLARPKQGPLSLSSRADKMDGCA
jgi:hypothetical protein